VYYKHNLLRRGKRKKKKRGEKRHEAILSNDLKIFPQKHSEPTNRDFLGFIEGIQEEEAHSWDTPFCSSITEGQKPT